jgi:hypothetical protein
MFPKMSTAPIIDNILNEDYDPAFSADNPVVADDCYSDRVVAKRKYIVIVRLCDIYATGIFKNPMSKLDSYALSGKSNRCTNAYKYCIAHLSRNKFGDGMVRLHLRAMETAKGRLVRFKVMLDTLHGPMADYWYVNLNHATVYSETAELIVNKTMLQICNRTNVDIGNHIRNMLG